MLSYENKTFKWKKRGILILSCFLIIAVGSLTWMMNQQDPSVEPTVAENQEVVLPLPDEDLPEIVEKPFTVEAMIAVDYFDGKNEENDAFTQFEGVYRSSQGIDYTLEGEAFDVVAMISGEVSDVREDELFGNTVVLQNGNLTITMQSLKDVQVKKGDRVTQGDLIARAGTCVYGKEFGNHLHLVVEANDQLIDPETVYGKSVEELTQSEK